ncbi:MAG TPA: hypothetical protein VEC93_13460 [Anaerolineae bacterium]|nr:hypothetical protein [Anaerolineae bacterium]
MFKVRVLTPAYLLTGEVEENNAFLGWLNNKDKSTLDLHNVEGLILDPNAAMPATTAKMVTLAKSQVVGIDMLDPAGLRTINVGSRAQLAVLYTARFIVQANLHPTGDMPISNIPNVVKSDFVPATQVNFHPLIPTRKLPSLESALILFNWRHIDFYHAR